MQVTHESRSAIERAHLFLQLASDCGVNNRIEFEAYIEAAIVFSRASLHRLQAQHEEHPQWKTWWNGLRGNPSVEFFRTERDWLLKEAPPKIGQRAFAASIGSSQPSYEPTKASEFYFFEDPQVSATHTVARHLHELHEVIKNAEANFV